MSSCQKILYEQWGFLILYIAEVAGEFLSDAVPITVNNSTVDTLNSDEILKSYLLSIQLKQTKFGAENPFAVHGKSEITSSCFKYGTRVDEN